MRKLRDLASTAEHLADSSSRHFLHSYISFWGSDLLRRPHLYGQSHPFSVANVPDSSAAAGDHHLQFVLRIHNGITRELAGIIARKTAASKSTSCPITISIEGLHGHGPAADEFDNVLLVAGGSGITHVASILSAVCMKADQGLCGASNVKLVWAVHHLGELGASFSPSSRVVLTVRSLQIKRNGSTRLWTTVVLAPIVLV